jgi:hypothetical protein
MHGSRLGRRSLASVAAALAFFAAALPGSAAAVHESHHGPFLGTTSQGERLFMRVVSHARVGIRVRWRARCESGSVRETTRFRKVPVGPRGRFSARRRGATVRGKIGWDPQGNPAFPEPFSFANNEAKGVVRVAATRAGKGRCRLREATWEASR